MQQASPMVGAFGRRLKQLREAAGLTQEGLAAVAALTWSTISKLESRKQDPSWSTVRKLAKALNVPVAEFDVDDPPEPEKPPAKKKPK